jgi:hypothetical protein
MHIRVKIIDAAPVGLLPYSDMYCIASHILYFTVLRSRSRKEPHLLVGSGAGSGAVTRCGSDNGIKHG